VVIDKAIEDNDVLTLENGITIKVIDTKGHSAGSLSFLWIEEGELFTGDSIPVSGDLPIYVSAADSIETLRKILSLNGVKRYLSAWDDICDKKTGKEKIERSLEFLMLIDNTVKDVLADQVDGDMEGTFAKVCTILDVGRFVQNPLFKTSIYANIRERMHKTPAFFIISTKKGDASKRNQYEEYLERVKPIVEKYGGEYIVRSERVISFSESWKPDRVIVIKFASKEHVFKWLSSPEYKEIMQLRTDSVESDGVIVEEEGNI